MAIAKLIRANFRSHRVRTVLTVTAIALAVSLVVAVTSGYASVEAAAYKFLATFMGSTDAQITREGDFRGTFDQGIIDELRADPDVRSADGRLEVESGLLDKNGKPVAARFAQAFGIRRPDDLRVETLRMYDGAWFETPAGNVAVIDQVAADLLKVKVGDSFALPGPAGQLWLQVVGIVHKPSILASQMQSIYVPIETLQRFTMPDEPGQVSRVLIDLRDNGASQPFADRWSERLAQSHPDLKLRLERDNRQEMDKNLQGLQVLSYLGGAVSMIAATFIVFSTLAMGVSERARTMAMMRAVGAQRRQLAGLVVLEGLLIALLGVMVGAPLGWFWITALTWFPNFGDFFTAGVVLSKGGVLFGTTGSLAAALVASILPAWSAMRVSPLEAMSPLSDPQSARLPLKCALAGILLICIDPILLHTNWEWLGPIGSIQPAGVSRAIKFYGHFALGLPALMLGFFLLAPLFVWVAEWVFGPVVALLFGVRFSLLRQQLSSGVWRAAGTCAALMVGLAILFVMQTQGQSMLAGWRLPDKFPDIFIVSPFAALDDQAQRKLETVEGIRPGEVMPIAIASPRLGSNLWALAGAAVLPDATMFFGVDPDKAFDMMELEFRDGTPEEARRMLKQGRHIIVTDEFRQLKGLTVGDTILLNRPNDEPAEYTIAGVVWSPGIDVIVSMFDMGRQFDQRTAASVFGTLEDAKRDFGVTGVHLFAANLDYFVEKEQVLEKVKATIGGWGMKAGDVRQIKYAIQRGFNRLLLLMSTVAFAAMAVASLGVTNTIMASIRSRRWQFGVLRAIGVTGWQLLRLVLAEAVLLGLVGVSLGLAAGYEMSLNARGLSKSMLGYNPPMVIPWGIILIGIAIVMAISVLASLWPAFSVARREPLSLLQAGRAST